MEADAADGEESDCYSRVMGASLVARPVKNPPPMQETWARSLGWEDPQEEGMASHFRVIQRLKWNLLLLSPLRKILISLYPFFFQCEQNIVSRFLNLKYMSLLIDWQTMHSKNDMKWKIGYLSFPNDWATSLSLFTFMHWRRKWQPTPAFLPGESQGRGSLVGCRLWGRTESDTTEVT